MTLPVTKEEAATWWNSEDVREARCRAKHDDTGDLRQVFVELYEMLDRREGLLATFRQAPTSPSFSAAAHAHAYGRPFTWECIPAITLMLDMGAEPERLKGVFPPRFVDRAVKTWQPWREEALKLARRGATPNEIRSAVTKLTMEASRETGQSKGQSWGNIVTMLKAHGFDYSQQPPPDTFPELAERREEIMKLVQQGLPKAEIARKFGLHRTAVNTLICRIREGRYPHLQRYLTPEMA